MPKEKRHIKATYANATPATDGRYVVAFFGSQGLYAYDLAGNLKWKRDLGRLDVGAYDDPSYEWGTASSPILYQDLVIVQCDQQKDSFLIALRLADGEVAWRASRDELPSWATPTVYPGASDGGAELVTNAPELHPRLRPRDGQGAVAARAQLEDHGADAGVRRRPDRGDERTPAERADLRAEGRARAAGDAHQVGAAVAGVGLAGQQPVVLEGADVSADRGEVEAELQGKVGWPARTLAAELVQQHHRGDVDGGGRAARGSQPSDDPVEVGHQRRVPGRRS